MNIVRNTLAEGAIHTRHSTDDLPVTDERLYRYHILFIDKFGYRYMYLCILAVLPRVVENVSISRSIAAVNQCLSNLYPDTIHNTNASAFNETIP